MAITTNERNYLLVRMEELLNEYDYSYTREALNKIIDEWESKKRTLIEAFKKHPNYVEGKFMIAFDTDFDRAISKRESYAFSSWLCCEAMYEISDYLPKEIKDRMSPGDFLPYRVYRFFSYLEDYAERCVSERTVEYLSDILPEVRVHAGQKTSRVINKICCYLGFDKVDGYNREFAKYADSLSPLTIKRHTVLSINPLDYLTMSFGNSWASCHTIDKRNKRRMPNDYEGCYSSGTISYMLDGTSMVLYTVDASYDGNEYWSEPKINRQMFHYGEEKLVQGRLYPQDNDDDGTVYTPYRNIVQGIIATIFNFPNLWTLSKGTEAASRYVGSYGTHYRDYTYYENCSLSRVKGSENCDYIKVGANPICVKCGERHSIQANISCCGYATCADCGRSIYSHNDVIEIDGETYCRGCVSWCEHCDEYTHEEVTYVDGYGYICQSCLDNNFSYCECCDTWHGEDETTYIECEDRYVCDRCLRNYYSYCEDCGNYFPDDDIYLYGNRQLCESCYDSRMENEPSEDEDEEEVC